MFAQSHNRFAMLAAAFALLLTLGAAQAAVPPAAPPLTVDPTQANLFYGAVPPNNPNGPVIVFVHGLSGTFMDWIEVKNCPAPSSLPSGYNCSGGGNTMYDMAYQAGFNTVFPSMNLNLTPDINDIQTDAAMLQTMFPKILSHYNVTQVYFVGHSKGGLDIQDAIATPQWLNLPKAVFLLATPNQGDALADWIFLPANQALGQLLGLLTPGEQSLQIPNVLQLRSQWDPLFTNVGYPFYTMSGDTFLCQHSGGGTCGTVQTGSILCTITGGTYNSSTQTCTGAPANDGLVTAPETLLPTSYAMDLGILHTNHFGMELGINSFSFIYARVIQQENSQPGLTRIATGGFGDQHNTWAWSEAWFKGKLYVGTGREEYCVTSATSAVQLGISALYPPAIGDCTPDFHHLPLQAEIWQFTPGPNTWLRVYQSPNSLTVNDNTGHATATARDIGFRSLSLVTEPGGVQALYAGGVTSGSIFTCTVAVPTNCAPQGTWAPPRILRSVDGVNWAPLPQDPGTFLANLTLNGTSQYPIYSIRSGQQLGSVLFLQVGDYPGVGRVISSIPGYNPSGGDNNYEWASPPTQQLPVWILENFNGFVYAGTGTPPGAPPATYGVFKTAGPAGGPAPYTWTQVVFNGAYATGLVSDYAMSSEIFTTPDCPGIGCLYFGTDRPNELIRIHPDTTGTVQVQNDPLDSWDLVIGNPRTVPPGQFGAGTLVAPLSGIGQYANNAFTGHFWRMGVGGQGLYMGTWDWSNDNSYQPTFGPLWAQEFGTDLFRTNDGTHWTSVSRIGLGDGNNTGTRSFAATPFGLYMGTARSVGGLQVFNVDNSTMDYNKDGVIDQNDVTLLTEHLGNLASGPNDPMDLNQDGLLTEADVQLLQTQCTYPNCAVPAKLPATSTLAAPVLHSAPATGPIAKGSPIALDWQPVSGAYDYLVYRIALSGSETVPPPGVSGASRVNGSSVTPYSAALASACKNPKVANLQTCYPYTQPHTVSSCGTTQAPCGYPGPPQLMGRVTGTTYSDTSLSNLQQLYYVLAEDSGGGLSAPSNMVGGPSLAAQ